MIQEKDGSAEIIERLMSSYGVSSQKDLAASLDIPANNISGWARRDSVPGDAIIKCVLDTGADLQWLTTGKFENASLPLKHASKVGKQLYDEIMSNGGKPVLRRILDAYGFSTQKQLCDLLDISSGTVSTWVRRDYFPGDVVVTCAIDTGVPLQWLATGKGNMQPDVNETTSASALAIKKYRLESGELKDAGIWQPDPAMLPDNRTSLVFVDGIKFSWLVDNSATNVGNGRWVINIDGAIDVFDVIRLPGNKARLSNASIEFECNLSDITPFGMVIITFEKHI